MALVAGVDSSTQSCKVVIRDLESGRLVRRGQAPHPAGTEVAPQAWWDALQQAIDDAGGVADVAALSVAAQQHGLVCLDDDGHVVRDALLWHDTRSADAARQLVAELPGGAAAWARAVGSVPVASFTITKLRWLAEHEPANARRTAAVCLPHDWLTWRLRGSSQIPDLVTDRGDASGTGYWSPATGGYRLDLLAQAFGGTPLVPTVLGPAEAAGSGAGGLAIGPGTGDNAAAALGVDLAPGDMLVSIGTSGVVSTVSESPTQDATGLAAGFADATNRYLPLAATLNGAPVLQATADLLGVGLSRLAELALSARPGAEGVVMVPYLAGERTPNRPNAAGALHGLRQSNMLPANIARAAVEGLLCGLADAMDAVRGADDRPGRVLLVGGGARNEAVRRIAPTILGGRVVVLADGEYVADGASRQAAWVVADGESPPCWPSVAGAEVYEADPLSQLRERYAAVRDVTATRREGS